MLYHGDCLDVLPKLPACSVDTCITDPPYELGFMGKGWDKSGVAFQPETWAAVLRVLKPGAMLLAFGGTRTYHRLTVAIEDAGFEVRDCMMWLYGSGFPKSHDISKAMDKAAGAEREVVGGYDSRSRYDKRDRVSSGTYAKHITGEKTYGAIAETAPATDAARQWDGWGTALKPAWEPIIVAMKPLDGTFAQNAQQHGVAGMHIDGGRIGTSEVTRRQNHASIGYGGSDVSFQSGGHAGGRWPANLLLSHTLFCDDDTCSPDCPVRQLDAQSGKSVAQRSLRKRAGSSVGNGVTLNSYHMKDANVGGYDDSGGASRFFYTAKASRRERGEGNIHPTVKPLALMEYLCRLTATPTGGIVLDPFAGSASTGVAALRTGRQFIGIEQNEEYAAIATARLASACRLEA